MPVIPVYQADLQQRTDSPVKVTDTDIARAQGQAISKFGEGVFDVGQVMLAQEKIREKTKYQIGQKNFELDAEDAANTIEKNALLQSEPDGSNMVSIAETEYDKFIQSRMKTENGSPEYLGLLNAQAKETRMKLRARSLDTSSKKYLEFADKGFDDIKNRYGSEIRKNPLVYDEKFQKYKEMVTNSAAIPSVKYNGIKSAEKEFSKQAIDSLIESERYDEAKSAIDNKFAHIYNGKEKEEWIDEIEGTRLKVADRKTKEKHAGDVARKEYLEIVRTKYVRSRLEEVMVARSIDPTQQNKVQALREMDEVLMSDLAAGDITETDYNNLSGILKKDKTEELDYNAVPYWDRLAKGKDLDKLASDVVENMRELDPNTVPQLLRAIDDEKEKQKKKPRAGADKRLQVAVNKLKAGPGYDVTGGFKKAEDGIMLGNALHDFWTEYYKSPKWHGNPNGLADKMLEKYYWNTAKEPAIMNMINYENSKDGAAKASRLFKEGKLENNEEYLEVLRAIKARSQKEKGLKKRKDGK
jgi:hypothetical protein